MALDESKDDDTVFEEDGLTFVINTELLDQVQPVKVDFVETPRGSGYSVTSNLSKQSACGSSCSC